MSNQNLSLSPRSLAELSLVISRIAPQMSIVADLPLNTVRQFWQSTRSLEHRWSRALTLNDPEATPDIAILESLAPRIFLVESVARMWSTALCCASARGGKDDMRRLARNAVGGLDRVRNQLLAQMLRVPELHMNRLVELERMRRRCERWTDLLLGPMALKGDCFDFAYHRERALDFSEEGLRADANCDLVAYEHLVSAGLLLTFNQHLSDDPLEEPEILDFVGSILAGLPHQAFHRDGTIRTRLERRIAFDRQRLDSPGSIQFGPGQSTDSSSNDNPHGGSFFLRTPPEV